MGAVKGHPFFLRAIDALPEYNRNWILPYITVMASTGPLFLSIIWRHFDAGNPSGADRVRVLFKDEYNNHPWSFFTHHVGNSWHSNDVRLIFWMARHWVFLTCLGFIVGFSVLFCLYWTYGRVISSHRRPLRISRLGALFTARRGKEDYELVNRHEV